MQKHLTNYVYWRIFELSITIETKKIKIMKTFKKILEAAKTAPVWEEGLFLLNWADRNATQEEKAEFADWVDGDLSNVIDRMPQQDTSDFFENAPSWDEIRNILD